MLPLLFPDTYNLSKCVYVCDTYTQFPVYILKSQDLNLATARAAIISVTSRTFMHFSLR